MPSPVTIVSAIKKNPVFWLGLVVFWLASGIVLLQLGRDQSFLMLTRYHTPGLDLTLQYFTHLGDGLFAMALVIFFWFRKQRVLSYCLLLAFLLSGILAQAGKFSFPQKRPYNYFESIGQKIHVIDGVTLMHSNNSFPSGHTASAFAMAAALVLLHPFWRRNSLLALLLAIVIGYTRMYLGNHFLNDVLVGSMLGALSACIAYTLANRWPPKFLKIDS